MNVYSAAGGWPGPDLTRGVLEGVVAGLQIQFELVVAGGGAAHVRWDHLLHCTYGHRVYRCTGLHAIERVAAGPR